METIVFNKLYCSSGVQSVGRGGNPGLAYRRWASTSKVNIERQLRGTPNSVSWPQAPPNAHYCIIVNIFRKPIVLFFSKFKYVIVSFWSAALHFKIMFQLQTCVKADRFSVKVSLQMK